MAKKMKKPAVQADWYVKFNAPVPQTNVEEPKLGEIVEFTVSGEVVKTEDTKRGDGETRTAVTVKLAEAWPEGAERPATQALMFDRTGEATAAATGSDEASADEGDEIMAKRAEDKAAAGGAGYSDDDKIDPETGEPWDYPAGEPATDDDGNPVRGEGD